MSAKHIMTAEIETKKGETKRMQWHIWQNWPCMMISGSGFLRWQGANGILPECGRPATGLKPEYTAFLLREDYDPEKHSLDSRESYASFNGNPAFVYRGRALGEITAEIKKHGPTIYTYYRTGYDEHLTPGENKLLHKGLDVAFFEYIEENAASLYAEAVENIRKRAKQSIEEKRDEIAKLEAEANEALAKL